MAERTENLLLEQNYKVQTLKRVLINFKKLSKANVTVPKVQGRLSALETVWAACQTLHVKLLQTATSEEQRTLPYFVNDDILLAEDIYNETADVLQDTISRLNHDNNTSLADHSSDSISRDSTIHYSRLPRISLPTFSGTLTEWEGFRNTFESLVANNDALSNTQKFHYLKTSVVGDAAMIISNLKISDANYTSAWQLLIDEYDDKQTLVYTHLHTMMSLPIMRAENVNDLRKLRDTVSASLAALKNLDRPVDTWDDMLVYVISQKFSPRTRNEWNLKRAKVAELPSYKDINEFLTLRIRGLSDLSDSVKDTRRLKDDKSRTSVNNVTIGKCVGCSGNHHISKCETFLRKTVAQRGDFARQNKLCFNCLRSGHFTSKCLSKFRCSYCSRSHHSLLHVTKDSSPEIPKDSAKIRADAKPFVPSTSNASAATASVQTVPPSDTAPPNVLLATAWVDLHTVEGRSLSVRALLDQGSTFSFISESLCQTLRTRRQRANLHIKSFGEKYTGLAKSRVTLQLTPRSKPAPKFPLSPYVFQRITSYAASQIQPFESWPHLQGLSFADPDPSSRHQIHLLIGADLYGSLLMHGLRKGPLGTPTAQLTALGWILSGPTGRGPSESDNVGICNCVSALDTNSLLQKFWEDEEVSRSPTLTEEEERCERHFLDTHSRSSDGRYIVHLPFRHEPPVDIGESLPIATLLYNKMETRLRRRADLSKQYNEFLEEYRSLGHMNQIDSFEKIIAHPVYIPHHPVIRESSCTTKLRVVFNASCKTTNGTSLNDHLLIGPKLQQDLPAILLRWRQWRFVYTADIAKMFRQILVHPLDTDFQRILWRPACDQPISHFRLLTVTYGLASAPYLAMRVLRQLALDEGADYPAAVPVLNESIYVDDALFGEDEADTLVECRIQLTALLKRGGFQLRKWASNSPDLLRELSEDQTDMTDHLLLQDETIKVLGISWLPHEDAFRFTVDSSLPVTPTKRSVLSIIARLYDPLGWAAPVVIAAKILLQELWILKSDWDSPLPDELRQRWNDYYLGLESLNRVHIPRWTGQHRDNHACEIHGFADASNRAYAAVVYLRVPLSSTDVRVCLVVAKTKVAPLQTISIPRLELNAIVLLSRLIKWVQNTLRSPPNAIFGWSDSSIALAWLRQHPVKWKTFVANRVSEVQGNLPTTRWNHVASKDNPADCASRGFSAAELTHHSLWWNGPKWLKETSTCWPTSDASSSSSYDKEITQQISSEARKSTVLHVESKDEWDLPHKFSSWTKLIRVTAYVRRFISKLKREDSTFSSLLLKVKELRDAESFWFRYIQKEAFSAEIKLLKTNQFLPRSSPLRALHPFIDADSLLRLGGRLKNTALSYGERHPVILPKHRVVNLLIRQAHRTTLHGGTQLMLRTLRQRYWILGGRNAVKTCVRECVTCSRYSALPCAQLMGDLPSPRVNPASPFEHTGIDYAGPFNVTPLVGRGQKSRKAYVALFICLATKAIHLELVEDYSTAGFLAAFKRFSSRRGLPRHLYSDNGTNFHGADRELQRCFRSLSSDPTMLDIFANDGIDWQFIPSAAPHFGGLWEAGVKSFKTHLIKIAGSRTLSQAEFATLLCEIEACLNSRPIAALSDDPSDLSALTPGHFLIGRPLISVPEESVLTANPDRLSRWQLVRSMQERLWRTWSSDYLHSLQQRSKWRRPTSNLAVGELVLLKNPLLPPSKWELARVQRTHPGSDGLVRVVTIRTARSLLKRPVTQLCKLPINGKSSVSDDN